MAHSQEVQKGQRFEFGKNWTAFLGTLDEERIVNAEKGLLAMLGDVSLKGKRFLDIGSGSGLSSLAARRLGARVTSFDYDPHSVACTRELRRRFFPEDPDWTVEEGSALDPAYLSGLQGPFDIVYSWGVLHHTGKMWEAIDNAASIVPPGGTFFIAIYNHMGGGSARWTWVKKVYCRLPGILKTPFALTVMIPLQVRSFFVYLLQGKVGKFIEEKATYRKRRGMSWWHDQIDWIGGYPYEDAKPEEVFSRLRRQGFQLEKMTTWGGGMGCNQYVFTKAGA